MGAPGFDDAPFVDVGRTAVHGATFVYPYYENPKFLARQLSIWSSYPDDVRRRIHVIVVDDGSPSVPAVDVIRANYVDVNLRLFRIDVDVRWNWLAARNIGAHHADDGWLVMTDMDHVIEPQLAQFLIEGAFDPRVIYRFSRCEHTGSPVHPHPNSMLMMRSMFWRIGGYDEALSGHYGTDGDWRRRCAAAAPVKTLRWALIRYEYVDDSSTTTYKRKQPEDAGKKAIIAKRSKGWRPKTLSFPYHEEPL